MCFAADQVFDADPAMTPADLAEIRWYPGDTTQAPIGFCDPLPASERPTDEDARGVPLYRHPDFALRDDPELWAIVARFRAGVVRELTHDQYESWPAWDLDAWAILACAESRQRVRDMKRPDDVD